MQIKMVNRLLHTISRVPRVFGCATQPLIREALVTKGASSAQNIKTHDSRLKTQDMQDLSMQEDGDNEATD